MSAKQIVDHLEPEKWRTTSIEVKLDLLKQIRKNLRRYMRELGQKDIEMKNNQIGEQRTSLNEGIGSTVVPVGNHISECIVLYESLKKGIMMEPIKIEKVTNDLYDIHVFPFSRKDKLAYSDRRDYIRVKGEPQQIHPMDKPGGIIAVLGAGNFSSSIEMITGLFLENCTVVHKPHHLNETSDQVWEKIMEPLVEYGALSFCSPKYGRELVKDPRLSKIYFTGGVGTAKAIMSSVETEFVSECGGNNPCIIVPGDKPWTDKELEHQAMQIATISKLNGGAVCGRVQTVVTSGNWEQREDFLRFLRAALEHGTPAVSSYYPGTQDVFDNFLKNHPEGNVLHPENGKFKNSQFLFIEGVDENSYAVKNEAFCQIINEVPLDVPANPEDFLPKAVEFCNTILLGSLGSSIIIDDETLKNHETVLKQAVTDMEYGAVGVNTMPPNIWLNPYLTWGGNEEGKEIVSGSGNFGNILNYDNVEKSIAYSDFMSTGHMIYDNKRTFDNLWGAMAKYSVQPSWRRLIGIMGVMIAGNFRRKDF